MEYCAPNQYPIVIKSGCFSWDSSENSNLRAINLEVKKGTKLAICGEVGSGKSTILAAILGEVPRTAGMINVCGKIAYVSQNAWIQSGSVQDNILLGSAMDKKRYEETLQRCSLVYDLEFHPLVTLPKLGKEDGGQKQRVQLACALYCDADIYLLDDPFSSVDRHTATSIFNEYVMGALLEKTVLLVTHQVDFLHAFDSILLMSRGQIMHAASYQELIVASKEFQDLVNAHKDTADLPNINNIAYNKYKRKFIRAGTSVHDMGKEFVKPSGFNQREFGDTGLKPYLMYLGQNKGYIYAILIALTNVLFTSGQVSQNLWLAANVENPTVSTLNLVLVYTAIGLGLIIFLLFRALLAVDLNIQTSGLCFPGYLVLYSMHLCLSLIPLHLEGSLAVSGSPVLLQLASFICCCTHDLYVCHITTSSKELMRINGTTKSLVANHLGESISGAVTKRAFNQEDCFFAKMLELIDNNAS
ncbi:hypothetical protein U9M48_040012, partial [Paspalum notatum var. saurae]